MVRNTIPIIRGLWGDRNKHLLREIFVKPVFKDETVYVWGIDNEKYLLDLGYKTHLMSSENVDPRYTSKLFFLHKIKIISEACKHHQSFIFLDWDCYLVRPLDDYFYSSLNGGPEIQMPSYSFPVFEESENEECLDLPFSNLPGSFFQSNIIRYSWHFEKWMISPNFCFFYTRNMSIGKELEAIIEEGHNLEGISDEHLFFLWANCTFDEYVQKHEPSVVYGVPDEKDEISCAFNAHVASLKNKRIYFKHV